MASAERSLAALEPDTRAKAGEWLRLCGSRGVAVLVYETHRSPKRQNMLYERGRTAPGPVVTNARAWHSAHQFGRAFDAVPWGAEDLMKRKLNWSPFPSRAAEREFIAAGAFDHLDPEWRVMAEAADEVGLEWAGKWTSFREYVHFQWLDGRTISQLRAELPDNRIA